MIFNLILVTFIPFILCMSQKKTAQIADDDFGDNDYMCLHDLSDSDTDINLQKCDTSGASSGSKRSRGGTSSTMSEKKTKTKKYITESNPIKAKVDDTFLKFIRSWEQDVLAGGSTYVWDDPNELEDDHVKLLCTNAWKFLKMRIEFEVQLTDNMKSDCSYGFILSGSRSYAGKKYVGSFQYLGKDNCKRFFPDLLRCNCAYLEMNTRTKKDVIVPMSKQFFFLLQKTEDIYYILTKQGNWNNNLVKIVNVYNHVIE